MYSLPPKLAHACHQTNTSRRSLRARAVRMMTRRFSERTKENTWSNRWPCFNSLAVAPHTEAGPNRPPQVNPGKPTASPHLTHTQGVKVQEFFPTPTHHGKAGIGTLGTSDRRRRTKTHRATRSSGHSQRDTNEVRSARRKRRGEKGKATNGPTGDDVVVSGVASSDGRPS